MHLPIQRRAFLSAAAATTGGRALACVDRTVGGPVLSELTSSRFVDPISCGIEHIIVVMMENRSFDHFLGWLPGTDGRQAGLSYLDAAGVSHPTHALAPDFQGCGHQDPSLVHRRARRVRRRGGARHSGATARLAGVKRGGCRSRASGRRRPQHPWRTRDSGATQQTLNRAPWRVRGGALWRARKLQGMAGRKPGRCERPKPHPISGPGSVWTSTAPCGAGRGIGSSG